MAFRVRDSRAKFALKYPCTFYGAGDASVVRWSQQSAELPDWQEAHRRMQAEGRPSKVRFPSAAHQRFEIPKPKG